MAAAEIKRDRPPLNVTSTSVSFDCQAHNSVLTNQSDDARPVAVANFSISKTVTDGEKIYPPSVFLLAQSAQPPGAANVSAQLFQLASIEAQVVRLGPGAWHDFLAKRSAFPVVEPGHNRQFSNFSNVNVNHLLSAPI